MCQSVSGTSCLLGSIIGSYVFQPKRHHLIAIHPLSDHKGGLLLVAGVHPDMVVARESVHEAKELVAKGGIYYEIDPR